MTTIRQAAYITSNRNAAYWLHQVNRDLPYGDIDAMIAEAVSHLSGVRLLVLDRVDVLDMAGREDLLYWLDGLAADGEIDSALLFATLKALPANLPENIEAIWIENGIAGKVMAAA